MMSWNTACATLELPADHTVDDVKPAFRLAVRRTHPDQTGSNDSERAFILVVEAYHRLTDHRELPDHAQPPQPATHPVGRTWQEWLVIALQMIEAWKNDTSPQEERYRFLRRDVGRSVYIKLICHYRYRFSSGTKVTSFSFWIDDEPDSYRELVRLHGEPIRVRSFAKRKKQNAAPEAKSTGDDTSSASRFLAIGRR